MVKNVLFCCVLFGFCFICIGYINHREKNKCIMKLNSTQLNYMLRKPECGACTSQNQNSNIAVSYEKRYKKDLEKPQWAHENIFTGCCGLCVAFGIPKPTDKNPWALLWKMLAYETSFAHVKKMEKRKTFKCHYVALGVIDGRFWGMARTAPLSREKIPCWFSVHLSVCSVCLYM